MFDSYPFYPPFPQEYLPTGDLENVLNLPGFPFLTYKEGSAFTVLLWGFNNSVHESL